ncbi:hypothetical protein llap_21199 [Limosa lapponica baueri]|uniref:Uncharacterized protein n=1 Tax=Limosa lapponica baueri TaxID=1758121 RepID=A0A2I0T3X9_LIMLA|nr:hypothetical protein llap_21199 [Limosa lapponica baueri]
MAWLLLAELRRKQFTVVPPLFMDCRKGWIYSQDTMAQAEIKKMTFEKEAPRESCWPDGQAMQVGKQKDADGFQHHCIQQRCPNLCL